MDEAAVRDAGSTSFAGAVIPAAAARVTAGGTATWEGMVAGAAGTSGRMGTGGRPSFVSCGKGVHIISKVRRKSGNRRFALHEVQLQTMEQEKSMRLF